MLLQQQKKPSREQLLDWTLRLWCGDQTVLDELQAWCRVRTDGEWIVLIGPATTSSFSVTKTADVRVLGLLLVSAFYGFSWPAEFKNFFRELHMLSR